MSLVSLPANLVVAPVVAPIMWLGMLVGRGRRRSTPALAAPLNAVNGRAGRVRGPASRTRRPASRTPSLAVAAARGSLGALAGYAALALALAARRESRRRRRARPRCARLRAGGRLVAGLSGARRRAAPRPGETVVSFLDVGQGDATLVQRDGALDAVDTGPPGGPIVARLRAVGCGGSTRW